MLYIIFHNSVFLAFYYALFLVFLLDKAVASNLKDASSILSLGGYFLLRKVASYYLYRMGYYTLKNMSSITGVQSLTKILLK